MKISETHKVPLLEKPIRLQEYGVGIFNTVSTKSSLKKAIKRGLLLVNRTVASTSLFIKGNETIELLESEKKPLFKMKKSIVASKNLNAGHLLKLEDIAFKSPGGGLEPYKSNDVVGKRITSKVNEDEIISLDNLN